MSPRSKEQFQLIRSQSQVNIIDSALDLFAHQGFHNTSISQIAKKAGVSKGLLYNYFPSKEALLLRIAKDAISIGISLLDIETLSKLNARKKLEHIIEASFQMVFANFEYFKLLTSLYFQAIDHPEIKNLINLQAHGLFESIETIFDELGYKDPKNEARLFGAMLDGLMFQYIQNQDVFPISEMKEFLIQKYCHNVQ